MRLLKTNELVLTSSEHEDFFAICPMQNDAVFPTPDGSFRVVLSNVDEVDWLKFAFKTKASEEGTARQKKTWTRAAELLAELMSRLETARLASA